MLIKKVHFTPFATPIIQILTTMTKNDNKKIRYNFAMTYKVMKYYNSHVNYYCNQPSSAFLDLIKAKVTQIWKFSNLQWTCLCFHCSYPTTILKKIVVSFRHLFIAT